MKNQFTLEETIQLVKQVPEWEYEGGRTYTGELGKNLHVEVRERTGLDRHVSFRIFATNTQRTTQLASYSDVKQASFDLFSKIQQSYQDDQERYLRLALREADKYLNKT